MPTLTSSNRNLGEFGWRFRITHIMEDLAELSQDVEALVAVKSRNLSQAYAYLRIAEIYKEQASKTRPWSGPNKALKYFSKNTDEMLIKFLADEYHRRARRSDAMALIWAGFSDRPSLESYQALKKHAHKAGDWQAWRKRLLLFWEDIEKDKQRAKSGPGAGRIPRTFRNLLEFSFGKRTSKLPGGRQRREAAPRICGWRSPPNGRKTIRKTQWRFTSRKLSRW